MKVAYILFTVFLSASVSADDKIQEILDKKLARLYEIYIKKKIEYYRDASSSLEKEKEKVMKTGNLDDAVTLKNKVETINQAVEKLKKSLDENAPNLTLELLIEANRKAQGQAVRKDEVGTKVQELLDSKISRLFELYVKKKIKIYADAKEAFEKEKLIQTKAGKLEGALACKRNAEDLTKLINLLNKAIKDTPPAVAQKEEDKPEEETLSLPEVSITAPKGPERGALQLHFSPGKRSIVRFPGVKDKYDQLTMEMWIRFSDRADHVGKRGGLKAHKWILGFHRFHRIGTSPNGGLDYRYHMAGNGDTTAQQVNLDQTGIPPVNEWHKSCHIASVKDNKARELRFYVNGKFIGKYRPFNTHNLEGYLTLGADSDGWFLKNSDIQACTVEEIRISNNARYEGDFPLPEHSLERDKHTVALYHFDEKKGDTLLDSSGNNLHGKIEGAQWTLFK